MYKIERYIVQLTCGTFSNLPTAVGYVTNASSTPPPLITYKEALFVKHF